MVYKAIKILMTIIQGLPLEVETPVVKLHQEISHKHLSKNIVLHVLHVYNDSSFFSHSLRMKRCYFDFLYSSE